MGLPERMYVNILKIKDKIYILEKGDSSKEMKNRRWNRSWAYPAASAIRKPHAGVVSCRERERSVYFPKHAVHCGVSLGT